MTQRSFWWRRSLDAIRDRALDLEARLIGSPSFQRWSERNPLTRRIAARQFDAVFDLCAGFVYSQVLKVLLETNLLEQLRGRAVEEQAVADMLGMTSARARLLVDAGVALKLLSRRGGGRIALGRRGAAIVSDRGIAAMVDHHGLFYADMAEPLELLRAVHSETRLNQFWRYAGRDASAGLRREDVEAYSRLMARSQPALSEILLDAYPFQQHRRVMDIGGGAGAFASALAQRHSSIEVTLFDLPAVTEIARSELQAAGLLDRIAVVGGDFRHDPLPAGHDAATLVRILHDHEDATAQGLLAAIRRSLRPGGSLIVAEAMSGSRDGARVSDVYFAFYLLAMGQGHPRSEGELLRLMAEAGFRQPRAVATRRPSLLRVLVAQA